MADVKQPCAHTEHKGVWTKKYCICMKNNIIHWNTCILCVDMQILIVIQIQQSNYACHWHHSWFHCPAMVLLARTATNSAVCATTNITNIFHGCTQLHWWIESTMLGVSSTICLNSMRPYSVQLKVDMSIIYEHIHVCLTLSAIVYILSSGLVIDHGRIKCSWLMITHTHGWDGYNFWGSGGLRFSPHPVLMTCRCHQSSRLLSWDAH